MRLKLLPIENETEFKVLAVILGQISSNGCMTV